ncbi:MAG: helix-turn-helix transcriptional regulator [Firmicutes bacterium]|nr:helix-turn-helix transcriptional regulator [Bacillota bacterium]
MEQILTTMEDRTILEKYTDSGQCTMTTYQVLPGVQLIYTEAHLQSVQIEERRKMSDQVFEISHCSEGRLECNVNGEFCYLSPGDLVIARANRISSASYFPLRHYHGVTVRIDLEETPGCLSCFLDDVTVQPRRIAEKFCSEKNAFIARENESFVHLFSELYSVPETIRKGYFKIKVLELMLFLSALDRTQDEFEVRSYTKNQVHLAKAVSGYLMKHMGERITLEMLSKHFHVSESHIKNTFKGVYGVSVGAYIRTQKMESASYMLEYTEKSILEIAGEHGYDNCSKFASAFRTVKGMAPLEYRNSRICNKSV